MITVRKLDTRSRADVNAFVDFPYRLYRDHPKWVPPPKLDMRSYLKKDKHPFFEHSDGDFFVAEQDGRVVGRVVALENRRYNNYHDKRQAQFYFFDSEDDQKIAEALFGRVFEWARERNLDQVIGPKGMGPLDGYGMLVEGFEHRQTMTMMNYNYPYYPEMMEALGFRKAVDFVSHYAHISEFRMPERVHRIAERVQERKSLRVFNPKNKRQLRAWKERLGRTYNQSFVENWEYYPLTDNEIEYVIDTVITFADPRYIKLIIHEEDVVGFLLAFPDVSAALQRAKGRLFPFAIFDLFLEMRRTDWVAINGAGILPEYQGRGGNALLYSEMEKTLRGSGFEHADFTQVAESAVQMRRDLENLGGKAYKNHRVFIIDL
jgi:GNAT superfamily N-acetyltransferase